MYITNGYNTGISKIIGDAFREESLARRSDPCSNSSCLKESQTDQAILIGILSTSELKNSQLLDGKQVNLIFIKKNKKNYQRKW